MTCDCPNCGRKLESNLYCTTLMYYNSPDGHNHDDNDIIYAFTCKCGARFTYNPVNECNADGCTWTGIDNSRFYKKGVTILKWS